MAQAGLPVVLLLYCVISCVGITWGLPSRRIDSLLFGNGEVWSGEKIFRLAHAGEKFSAKQVSSIGADVDVNPFERAPATPVLLTATEEDVAKIYLRYRLYTYQPDEMITMMALAGMRPGELQLDPRLYQYGGLFIYPVGALIKLCGILGLIDVRSDIVFYLDHPDEFGKFYVVARAYSAAWGLVGVIVVFALTRRISEAIRTPSAMHEENQYRAREEAVLDDEFQSLEHDVQQSEGTEGNGNYAGLLAALLFVLMPVVVCMSHEGKPHLPGAVLMLLAVYLAILAVQDNRQSTIANRKWYWLMCVCCGAAVGMVLSSWPICVLIPLTAFSQYRGSKVGDGGREGNASDILSKTFLGGLVSVVVYFSTNPYVLVNFFVNREVLRSNFGNSLAMYEVTRLWEGLDRVIGLTVRGATLPVMIVGLIAIVIALTSRLRKCGLLWLLFMPALLFSVQFVLLGAGKPAEYGRFGIFTNSVLAILSAIFVQRIRSPQGACLLALFLLAVTTWEGLKYVNGFYSDTTGGTSRLQAARDVGRFDPQPIYVPVEPAPYCFPPINFARTKVALASEGMLPDLPAPFLRILVADYVHSTPISWANKRFIVVTSDHYRTWQWPARLE